MKIYVPVIDTENLKFEYKGRKISVDEYREMVYNHIQKNAKSIDWYISNNKYTRFGHTLNINFEKVNDFPDFKYKLIECIVKTYDANLHEASEEYFHKMEDVGKMFITVFDFNPNDIDYDAESEIRFWRDDSSGILRDKMLPDDVKLKNLPIRDLYLDIEGHVKHLQRCKIVEIFPSKKRPYKIAVISDKITN